MLSPVRNRNEKGILVHYTTVYSPVSKRCKKGILDRYIIKILHFSHNGPKSVFEDSGFACISLHCFYIEILPLQLAAQFFHLSPQTIISSYDLGPDLSILKPPILTTITGMKQAVHSLETGSLEVKRVLLNEANLIYECKVCLGMFRSIANLGNLKEKYSEF